MSNIDPKIHRSIVADLINVFAPCGIGVEIGVKKAKTSSVILQKTNIKHIYLIDPWYKQTKQCSKVTRHIQSNFPGRATILRKKSEDATKDVPDGLDFIWIDGNHDYDYVMKDLTLWVPKVRSGGLIVGHDWGDLFPGVKKAVVAYSASKQFAPLTGDYKGLEHRYFSDSTSAINVAEYGNIWWVLKPTHYDPQA